METNKNKSQKPSDTREIIILNNKKLKPKANKIWLVQVFIISLCLSVSFAFISQLTLSHAGLALALFMILLLVFVSVITDIIGVAITACSIKPFLDLSQKGIRGADISVKLIKNADKVSSICADVIGDICSILSGAGGVAISVIFCNLFPGVSSIIISIIISSIIASITILGKAIGKTYAMNNPVSIVLRVGKYLSFFRKIKKK